MISVGALSERDPPGGLPAPQRPYPRGRPPAVGMTTLVRQELERIKAPSAYVSADEPSLRGAGWVAQQGDLVRIGAREASKVGAVLALYEIQKVT